MKSYKIGIVALSLIILLTGFNSPDPAIGTPIDFHLGIPVYFNGRNFKRVGGRHITQDGYNLGLKYQCVEFVKRFYYEHYGHKMPNSYGHAKDFFDTNLPDVGFNVQRGLMQFRNVREEKPQLNDIIVYGPHEGNPYGHVAIVVEVTDRDIEIIQQNKRLDSRQRIPFVKYLEYYTVADYNVLGWLRKVN